MKFRLRTLLIVLAVGPPLIAGAWWILRDERRRELVFALISYVPSLLVGLAPVVVVVFAIAFIGATIAGAITGKR